MFGLQPGDILIIVIVALLLFGPNRLPDVVRSIGKGIREFQGAMKEEPKRPSQEPTAAQPAKEAQTPSAEIEKVTNGVEKA